MISRFSRLSIVGLLAVFAVACDDGNVGDTTTQALVSTSDVLTNRFGPDSPQADALTYRLLPLANTLVG